MLKAEEIKKFIDADEISDKKRQAKKGQAYYEGEHDIKNYRVFYYDKDGVPVEDTTRSNVKISHPFFTELTDQTTQYILSGKDGFIKSDIPELQAELDAYFNENEDFTAELSELITDCQIKGFAYMHSYKDKDNKTAFHCADAIGVVEVEARFASDKKDHVLYWYIDRIDKDGKRIKRIMDWEDTQVSFYVQVDDGQIKLDANEPVNPKPHTLYKKKGKEGFFRKKTTIGEIPFYRIDNNKKQTSNLKPIKPLIDDYDLMSCGLTNNIQDAAEYLVVVSGFQGDDMEELMQNTRTKKHIGVDEGGDVDFKTVDIPYEARKVKLELDEKNIYRFGMGLNTSGLKDTSATTNIAIKAAYSLLDLKATKLEIKIKQLLRKLIKVVLQEINETNKTDYQMSNVYIEFIHEVMSNEQENATIAHVQAQEQQVRINTLLSLATQLDNETLMQNICEVLDIDYEEIKDKLPDPDEAENAMKDAQDVLNSIPDEEGEVIEEV